MRVSTALTLFVSSLALVACGGTAEETLDLAGDAPCGLACPVVKLPPKEDDRTTPQPNTGNKEDISQEDGGDDTIVLESSVIKNLSADNPAYSKLTFGPNKKTARIAIDPNVENQESWPKPVEMDYFETPVEDRALDDLQTSGANDQAKAGNGTIDGDGTYREYRALSRSETGTAVDEELQVWTWKYSYAAQYRDASGGGEAIHQAFSFGPSGSGKRTTAVPTSGDAKYIGRFGTTAKTSNWIDGTDSNATLDINNLWQVNGRSVTDVDFATGQVKATLIPEKWQAFQNKSGAAGFLTIDLRRDGDLIDPSGNNDDSNRINISNTDGGTNTARDYETGVNGRPDFVDSDNPDNVFNYMRDQITLSGKLTKDAKIGNSISGKATMRNKSKYVSGGNGSIFKGALFGPNAEEFTGIFNIEAVAPEPDGQDFPINDDRRGFVNHSGVVNGKKK